MIGVAIGAFTLLLGPLGTSPSEYVGPHSNPSPQSLGLKKPPPPPAPPRRS